MISANNEVKKKKWSDFKKSKQKVSLVLNRFDETDWTW